MAGKMAALRGLAEAVGKGNIVPRVNKVFGIERVRINPQTVDRDKLGEIRCTLGQRATARNRVAQMVAADALRNAFSLRAKESLTTAAVLVKDGKEHLSVEGAKGVRPRLLAIDSDRKTGAVKQDTYRGLGPAEPDR